MHRQNIVPRFDAFARSTEAFRTPRLGPILFLFVLSFPVCAQEFVPDKVVFPITDFKPDISHLSPLSLKFATGFCLDPDCRFVCTNYHAAKFMGKYVRVKGVWSAHRYLDSGPDDEGAQEVKLRMIPPLGESLKYTLAHDLAIYEMRHPLKGFHGIGFDADDLEHGEEVDIYAYPFNWNPKRALVHWHGSFIGKTYQRLIAFSYEEGHVRGGASGGIVVNRKSGKIVGILSSAAQGKDRVALAVPVKELSDFIARSHPYLQTTLFPKTVFVSPVAADLYPPYVWEDTEDLPLLVDSPEVIKLRRTAQHLADSMRNFTATQTFAWGRDNREPDLADAYETLIVDGWQRWHRPGNKKFYDEVPFPPLGHWLNPGAEWSQLPEMVGTELALKVRQAPDTLMAGRTIHVFQYAAKAEFEVCSFRYVSFLQYVGFQRRSKKFYDCHGEVWMDDSGTILRISETVDLTGPSYHYWAVITYGWLEKDGAQHLVPVTIATQVEEKNKSVYWCRGLFTDYGMFDVKSRLVLPSSLEQAKKSELGTQ